MSQSKRKSGVQKQDTAQGSPPPTEIVVISRCVECGKTREIHEGEVPAGEMPMCGCGSIMLACAGYMR